MVKNMLDGHWQIYPAGGVTGQAFYACHEDERLFIKRNSSPFLAVLSAEGIVPKLIWTKRLESGDTITAQQWVTGRKLNSDDMKNERVAKLLKKIHRSKPLLKMLRRLGKTPVLPENMLKELRSNFPNELLEKPHIQNTFHFLTKMLPDINYQNWSVCHGDVNHNNWILTEQDELYLIDWEGALIADPAMDIGPMLYWYIPEENWDEWLSVYGMPLTDHLKKRMKWYVLLLTLYSIQFFHEKGNALERDCWLDYLETIK